MTGVDGDDLAWDPPGPGQWYSALVHMPTPMPRLVAALLPGAGRGWAAGTARYGLPPNTGGFGISNCWGFFTPGVRGEVDLAALERTAAESLATRRWRGELRRWRDEVRPAVVAANRALLAVDLPSLDDDELAEQVRAALDGFATWSPQHFERMPDGAAAVGALLQATTGWGLDPHAVLEALAGASTASSSAERLYDRIAAGLRAAGATDPADLDAVRAVGGDAAEALDDLLVEYGWRSFGTDLSAPTLAERPDAVLASIRAALAGWGERTRPDGRAMDALRAQVPAEDHARFDELLADARAGYGNNDDNSVVLFSWPMGLVRRAALEVGRRALERGQVEQVDDALETTPDELVALARGDGPSRDELAGRRRFREAMAGVEPPGAIGEPLPQPPPLDLPPSVLELVAVVEAFRSVAWTPPADRTRAAATVGTAVVRGRAVVVAEPTDAMLRMEPGDVLVAATTSAPYNVVFPIAGAVAVRDGTLMDHAAVLARELGVTAVIGVPDLLERVADGDLVEVDPVAGTIEVVERAR